MMSTRVQISWTSGRDLLRLNVKTKAQGGGVVFADPAFDNTGKKQATDPNGTRGRRIRGVARGGGLGRPLHAD